VVSNFIIYHVVDGVRKLARSNTMATSTPLEEPAALAKRIEDFVSAIERPMIALPAARLAGYQGRYLVGNAPATVAIADAWCSSSTATQTCHHSLPTTSDFFVRTTGTRCPL
jgi:hypothetical protein